MVPVRNYKYCVSIMTFYFLCAYSRPMATTAEGFNATNIFYVNTTLTGLDRMIQNHRAICRVDDLCNPSLKYHVHKNWCCGYCSCQNSCVTQGNCCPEVLSGFWQEKDPEIGKACLKPGFGISNKLIELHYQEMIAACPRSFRNKEIIQQCENRDESLCLKNHLPVTDDLTTTTYANKYCAECQNANKERLVPWTVMVECISSFFSVRSEDSLLSDIEATEDCYLKFQPNRWDYFKGCSDAISSCNVTGKWEIYDNFIDQACKLDTAPYRHFKNPFCAICNGYDVFGDESECEGFRAPPTLQVPSFSALLGVKLEDDQKEDREIKKKCLSSQIYDSFSVSITNISMLTTVQQNIYLCSLICDIRNNMLMFIQ